MTVTKQSNMRLSDSFGLYLDRNKPITFQFDNKTYSGFKGDSISSALAANDVRLISRSFKYHRPRGIFSMAGQDSNTLVQVGDEPSARADTYPITDGLNVDAQNVFGSLKTDYASCIGWFSKFLPVGFYYKAFYKPKGIWKYWEPVIRRLAGLGSVDLESTADYTDKAYRFTDVAVIGAGPAGLKAALEAAESGAEVILIDECPMLGGSLNYARFMVNNVITDNVRRSLIAKITIHSNITILQNTTCTGWFADNWLALMQSKRLIKLRAKAVVIATGSFEQPAIFRNNDLPGVMLGSAAQRLIKLYAVKPGKSAVVLTGNDDGYGVALDLLDANVVVKTIIDMRVDNNNTELVNAVKEKGIKILQGHTVYEAIASGTSLRAVVVDEIISEGKVSGKGQTIGCDLLCMSAGYTPAAQLVCHSGGKLLYDEQRAMLKVSELPLSGNAVSAGSLNAITILDNVIEDGKHAGWQAAKMAGMEVDKEPVNSIKLDEQASNYPWPIFTHPKGKDFVDLDEDLQVRDILNAVADGYDDLELVKRYSTVVMGPSQGRQSALNNLRLVTKANNASIENATLTTQRPPFQPELIQNLAGRSFQPLRRTAMHHRHLEAGAEMMSAGLWMRPAYYGKPENNYDCIQQEALAIRENVGLIDVSTLGKIEVRGPDAGEFMNRMYTFAYAKQPVGRTRYVLMTEQAGTIIDDGVSCRFADDHFYVTATTSGVESVYRSMLHWNAEWCLDIDLANVTSAYAAVNLAGPKSREVLDSLTDDIDLSKEAFPHLELRSGHIAGIPANLLRVGFVGELGYEIHVPSSQGEALWDILLETGKEYGICPCGIEAQRLLRLEKGHIIVGQDTDGLTMPQEVDMSWAIAKKKPFFVGKRAVDVFGNKKLTRQLVGFTLAKESELPLECNIVVDGNEITGRVTSLAYSPSVKKNIGLAYVAPEQSNVGDTFNIKLTSGKLIQATVTQLPFYDAEGKRQEL